MRDPYAVVFDAFTDKWQGELSPGEVVDIAFTALDEAGDQTVPRDDAARERAVSMVGAVFADIGAEGECDSGAVASNLLRAAEAQQSVSEINDGEERHV